MSRVAVFAAVVAVVAAPALAQRLDVDPARTTSFEKPIPTRPGELIASEISETDFHVGLDKRTEQFAFTGRAGEVVTAQTRSDIRALEVVFMEAGSYRVLARGLAADAPISVTLPRDGRYFLIAGAKGPRRFGKYLLSFGSAGNAPSFDAPAAAPLRPHTAVVSARVETAVDDVKQTSGAGQAPRLEVDPLRWNHAANPVPARPGSLIASELSEIDAASGVERSAEWFVFRGRAGEVITAQVLSDIPSLQVLIRSNRGYAAKALVEGPAKEAPLRLVLPQDDTYAIAVHTRGPQRFGKYLLSLGLGDTVPTFDPPPQVAQAGPVPSSLPGLGPATGQGAPSASGPLVVPDLPTSPGVTNVRSGETLSRAGSKTGAHMETFQVIGARGDRLRVTATASPAITLTLYTPEGASMLTAEGVGTATLEAYLPIDGVYFIVAGLADRGPYKLTISTQQADVLFAHFMAGVGYEVAGPGGAKRFTCWARPGKDLRSVTSDGVDIQSTWLSAGKVRVEGQVSGTKVGFDQSFTLEGDTIVTNTNGTIVRSPVEAGATGGGIWRGYLCG